MTFFAIRDTESSLDWTFDWSDWLASGETISSVAWSKTGDITIASASGGLDVTNTLATNTVSGGTVGTLATLRCKITTSASRVDARTIQFTNMKR